MNIERAIVAVAGMIVAAIIIVYTFGLENKLPILSNPTASRVAIAATKSLRVEGEVADLQALAEYQAKLPMGYVRPHSAQGKSTPVEQIADLQALAEYQATLPITSVGIARTTPPHYNITEQIANLQELAQYQTSLPRYYMEVTE